jgi:hypothetical protein
MRTAATISIPRSAWTDAYGDGTTLLTTIGVGGCNLHLEAIAVEWTGGVQRASTRDSDLGVWRAATGAGGPWETLDIDGQEYVLVATPYCS